MRVRALAALQTVVLVAETPGKVLKSEDVFN